MRKALLKFLFPLLRRLDPKRASRSLSVIGRCEYRMLPGVRSRFDRAVERARAHFGAEDWDVPTLARELAGHHIRFRTRDHLLDGLPDDRIAPVFRVEGKERLDEALERGRGALLLGNHYGANLMPAHWLIRAGYPFRMFMERPRHVSRLLREAFEGDGPLGQRHLFISRKSDPAESARSILRAAKALKAGMVVMAACDVRWSGPNTTEAEFLGDRHSFSTTWLALAALSGSPVVPVFCHMEADGGYRLEFAEAFETPGDANRREPERWTRMALEQIERRVREAPTNSNDYFFWEREGTSEGVGSGSESGSVEVKV